MRIQGGDQKRITRVLVTLEAEADAGPSSSHQESNQ
jgi:hypothetical protein